MQFLHSLLCVLLRSVLVEERKTRVGATPVAPWWLGAATLSWWVTSINCSGCIVGIVPSIWFLAPEKDPSLSIFLVGWALCPTTCPSVCLMRSPLLAYLFHASATLQKTFHLRKPEIMLSWTEETVSKRLHWNHWQTSPIVYNLSE